MRQLWWLYWRELRSAWRERNLVIYSFLIPLLLYPMMMWLVVTGILFVEGQTESQRSRIVLVDLPAEHAGLAEALEADERIERVAEIDGPRESILRGDIDLAVQITTQANADGGSPTLRVQILYDSGADRSKEAKDRAERHLRDYRRSWAAREAEARGIDQSTWDQFEVARVNTSSERDMGAFLLGQLAPLTMIIMVAMGSMYPAVDSTAGERERNTWETSLTLGTSRTKLMLAKYLYVATLGSLAGVLNMTGIAISLTTTMKSLLKEGTVDINVPLTAIPIVLLGIVLLALSIAAAMMVLAAFAKTFREGQSLTSPLFIACVMPVMIAGLPEETIGLELAAIPIANIMILFRQAISSTLEWDFALVTIGSSVLLVALLLRLAAKLLSIEALVLASYQGSAKEFMRAIWRGRKKGATS